MFGCTGPSIRKVVGDDFLKYVREVKDSGSYSVQLFRKNSVINWETGCIEWTGLKLSFGRGHMPFRRKASQVHRVSYMLHYGPIPVGLFVCHTCDNPICFNPDHLFLGTHQDNMRDMAIKDRTRARVHLSDILEIRRLRSECKLSAKDLSELYGMSTNTIWGIIKKRSYKYL